MNNEFEQELHKIIDENRVLRDEPMSAHTTFRVGGPADYFVMPHTALEVQLTAGLCREKNIPFYVLGNGSNLLVSDAGYRGVVIQLGRDFSAVTVTGNHIKAQVGALLSQIANEAWKAGLAGMEFAAGIPGSLGGALVMNAGAYGGEMKDIVIEADVLDHGGNVRTLNREELAFGYRSSTVSKNNYIALQAEFELKEGDRDAIKTVMDELKEKRTSRQPLKYASAGSTFKRPEGHFAGKLIEEAGLRGYRVGDAQVSEKHCGFVINRGTASAADIISLMQQVIDKVEKNSGVRLEPEVKKLGEF